MAIRFKLLSAPIATTLLPLMLASGLLIACNGAGPSTPAPDPTLTVIPTPASTLIQTLATATTLALISATAPSATATSVPSPIPEPLQPGPTPAHEPTSTPVPAPTGTFAPTPTPAPVAVATLTTTPTPELTPEPTPTQAPTPEPAPATIPTPDPTPTPQLGLAQSPWPMLQGDAQHTGASPYIGPEVPSVKWSFDPGGGALSSPAIGPDGTLYAGSADGKAYAVSHDGAQQWSVAAGNPLLGSPAISADGTIYFASYESDALARDATLYAINPEGSLKWSFSTEGTEIFPPTIGSDGTIYIGVAGLIDTPGAGLYAIKPDGSLKWRSYEPVDGAPVIDTDGNIYSVGSCSGDKRLQAFNPAGQLDWNYPLSGCPCSSPTIGPDGTVYVGTTAGNFYAVNPDGSLKWALTAGSGVPSDLALAPDGAIYVASDYVLYGIGPDGSREWDFAEVPGVQGAPSIGADGTIHVASEEPSLYAFNPDGSVKWSLSTGDSPPSPPVIGADGTIYFASGDGKLFSIGEAPSGTPIPVPEPRFTLRINQTTWEPGRDFSTIQVIGGTIMVDPPPDRDGKYAIGTYVGLMADGLEAGAEVLWGGADGAATAKNTLVRMNEDKVVLVAIQSASGAPATTPLFTPTLVSPAEGAILDNGARYDPDSIDWDFDWSDRAGVTRYHLYVKHSYSPYPGIDDQNIVSSSYIDESPGSYIIDRNRYNWTWKVRAMVDGQWGEWSETRSFDVEPLDTDVPSPFLMTAAPVATASPKIITGCGLTEIGNHLPPIYNEHIMTFKLDAIDHDHGIASGESDPAGGYAISAWGFNRVLREFAPLADASRDSDFSLISGSNAVGQLGTYQLVAVSIKPSYDRLHQVEKAPGYGYYFRIVDEIGDVIYIGAGGQQYISEALAQSNTIPFWDFLRGSAIIELP